MPLFKRRTPPKTQPANPCWVDGQFLIIDVSAMQVSHRGEKTTPGKRADDAKIMTFLGAMNNCKIDGKRRPQLDTSKAGIAATGITRDNQHLRLAIAPSEDPNLAWIEAYTCWKSATGRSLWREHGIPPHTASVPER